MFILKGVLLGIGMFGIGVAIYVTAMTRLLMKDTPAHPGTVIGIDFVTMLQHNHLCSSHCWPALRWDFQLSARGRRASRPSHSRNSFGALTATSFFCSAVILYGLLELGVESRRGGERTAR
jgi:hypothetical protein